MGWLVEVQLDCATKEVRLVDGEKHHPWNGEPRAAGVFAV